jgi:hypothetical protein
MYQNLRVPNTNQAGEYKASTMILVLLIRPEYVRCPFVLCKLKGTSILSACDLSRDSRAAKCLGAIAVCLPPADRPINQAPTQRWYIAGA